MGVTSINVLGWRTWRKLYMRRTWRKIYMYGLKKGVRLKTYHDSISRGSTQRIALGIILPRAQST